jgi:hypothetical protein
MFERTAPGLGPAINLLAVEFGHDDAVPWLLDPQIRRPQHQACRRSPLLGMLAGTN